MNEKSIKFKLENKFFNEFGYLDNKYIYDWLSLARKYFLSSFGIEIDSLNNQGFYYADNEIKISIKENIKFKHNELIIKVMLQKHSGVKTVFNYEFYVDGKILGIASSSHSMFHSDSDRSVRMDRYLPKWDIILKDIVNNDL